MKKDIELIIDNFLPSGIRYGFAKPRFQKDREPRDDIKTAIVFLFSYPILSPQTNISNYARIPDYHLIVRRYLNEIATRLRLSFSGNFFDTFVDTSLFDEVSMASAAGLGVIGKNRLLISKEFGSYNFIGGISCDISIECTDMTTHCFGCGSCEENCYGALGDTFCKENCLSFFSQSKGELTDSQKEIIKKSKMVWGCDRCQTVCPLNLDKTDEVYEPFCDNIFDELTKENLKSAKERAFFWRGEKPLLRNLNILEDNND